MTRRPAGVLFVCGENALRSPIAEGMLKLWYGSRIYVDSVGVRKGALDPLAVAVSAEIGVDISRHRAKTLDDLTDASFDLVVCLTQEAEALARDAFRNAAIEFLFWPSADPSAVDGNREMRLSAYRALRENLAARIYAEFGARSI